MYSQFDCLTCRSSDRIALSRRYYNALRECDTAAASLLRHAIRFFYRSPATPLRVLCIMAFDTLRVLGDSTRLPLAKVDLLATVLDFAAHANSILDYKAFSLSGFESTRKRIEVAGEGHLINEYLMRLREIESCRRTLLADSQACEHVRYYRESVVRLNLGLLFVVVFDLQSIDEGISCSHDDRFNVLLRIVMLMQVVDDVIDYHVDVDDGLPSFLTAADLKFSLPQSAEAARRYASVGTRECASYPLRLSLACVSSIAQLAIQYAYWRYASSSAKICGRLRHL